MSMGGLRHWLDVAGEYGLSARAWQFRRCAQVAGATDIASAQKQSLSAERMSRRHLDPQPIVPSVMASGMAWFSSLRLASNRRNVRATANSSAAAQGGSNGR